MDSIYTVVSKVLFEKKKFLLTINKEICSDHSIKIDCTCRKDQTARKLGLG